MISIHDELAGALPGGAADEGAAVALPLAGDGVSVGGIALAPGLAFALPVALPLRASGVGKNAFTTAGK
jgi:hypothetical protein